MILFLARLIRILAVLFVIRLVLRAMAGALRPSATARRSGDVDLVRDRICNTFLPREGAIRRLVDGREQFFCSSECAKRAQAQIGA